MMTTRDLEELETHLRVAVETWLHNNAKKKLLSKHFTIGVYSEEDSLSCIIIVSWLN